MSGPEDRRRGDAFDDFFGDPSPSGRMGPAAEQRPRSGPGDTPTTRMDADGGDETQTQPTPTAEPSYEPTIATGAVPERWWAAEPEKTAAAPASTWETTATPPREDRQPPRKGISTLGLVAMLVGGVLLGGLVVGGVMAMGLGPGSDDSGQPTARETVTETGSPTSTTEPSESSSDTSSSSSPSSSSSSSSRSSSSSSSSSTTAERSGTKPADVSQCAGPSGGVAVGTGSDVTSCAFAVAVRDAYVAGDSNGAANLRVTSPVTNKAYTMSCSGAAVTTCTGGNNAVVVLY
ncbi:hypothetical protein [Janibacter alittae]|uniref:Serine/threonine protein kinase n=1 Tax=Janibacter alittae TaxID=3115209 RepID=A0ABZ2MHG4_9MICO